MQIYPSLAKHIPSQYLTGRVAVPEDVLRKALEKYLSDSDLVTNKSERYEMVYHAGEVIDHFLNVVGYSYGDLKISYARKSLKFPTEWLYLRTMKIIYMDDRGHYGKDVRTTTVSQHTRRNGSRVRAHLRKIKSE